MTKRKVSYLFITGSSLLMTELPVNPMKLLITLVVVALALVGMAHAAPPVDQNNPESVIREFLRALYTRDKASFDKVIVPHPDAGRLLGQGRVSPSERKRIEGEVARLKLELSQEFRYRGENVRRAAPREYPVGTIARYETQFQGMLMIVTVVKRSEGWKVDLRWWLAMLELARTEEFEQGSPEYAIKALLLSMLANNREDAQRFVVPGADLDFLFRNAPRQPEPSGHLSALALEMPLVEVGPGEYYRLLTGEIMEGSSTPEETKLLVGLFGPFELPFIVRKVEDEWRVVPQPFFMVMNR